MRALLWREAPGSEVLIAKESGAADLLLISSVILRCGQVCRDVTNMPLTSSCDTGSSCQERMFGAHLTVH